MSEVESRGIGGSERGARIVAIRPNAGIHASAFIDDVVRKKVLEPYLLRPRVLPGLRRTAIKTMKEDDAVVEEM